MRLICHSFEGVSFGYSYACILRYNGDMKTIRKDDRGAAVEDVQQRLASLEFLDADSVNGIFTEETATAVRSFCEAYELTPRDEVDNEVWAALVDASFRLGDRTLYLRVPNFRGSDVSLLQRALSALGFACGDVDGNFGAHTEQALRQFQMNLGLPSDGIAGAYTFSALHNLEHSWRGKGALSTASLGFARAADVLEQHALCLFGTQEFTRSVASRMSNLALATNPASKILSADSLLVAPDEAMLLVHIVMADEETEESVPRILYEEGLALALRLKAALEASPEALQRIAIEIPGRMWMDAGEGRSAQHYAISLLDALCSALHKTQT